MTVQNVGAYAFTLVAARLLIPSSFGALTALLGVILVANVGSLAVQTTTARRIAVSPDSADRIAATATTASLGMGAVVGGMLAVLSPLIADALRLDSPWPVVLCGAAVVPLTLMGALAGIAQGQHRWTSLSLVYVASGLGRIVFGTAALLISATPTAAVAGVMVGAWLPIIACGRLLRAGGVAGGRPYVWEVLAGSHAMLAYLVLSNLDALLARIALDPHDSGLYGAGLILTKAALFLPQFVSIVAFPRLARARADRARRLATLAVAVVGACATAATAALSGLALVLVGGDQYAEVQTAPVVVRARGLVARPRAAARLRRPRPPLARDRGPAVGRERGGGRGHPDAAAARRRGRDHDGGDRRRGRGRRLGAVRPHPRVTGRPSARGAERRG